MTATAPLNVVPEKRDTSTPAHIVLRYAKAFKEWEQVKDFTAGQLEHPGRRALYDRRKEELAQAQGSLFASQTHFAPDPLWPFVERDSVGRDCLDGECLQEGAKLRVHFSDGSIETVLVKIVNAQAFAVGYLVKAVPVLVPLFGLRAQFEVKHAGEAKSA